MIEKRSGYRRRPVTERPYVFCNRQLACVEKALRRPGLYERRGGHAAAPQYAPVPPSFDPALKLDTGAINIPIEIDSRDHEQFPREGWLVKARGMFYREVGGQ